MKRLNIFLIFQYLSLAATIAVPVISASFFSQEVKRFLPGLGCILLILLAVLIVFITLITEIVCVRSADKKLKFEPKTTYKIWKKLKLLTIPFYIINVIAYAVLAPITFPLSLVIFPLDALLCMVMIVLSGICGINSIKAAKKSGKKICPIHYAFQVLPVLDVFSTLALKRKVK